MIAACPKCSARYRIDGAGLRPEGVRLRCSKCEAVFRVRAPEPRPRPEVPPAAPAREEVREPRAALRPPAPAPEAVAAPVRRPVDAPPPSAGDSVCVLVADPMVDEGKATANALAGWGIRPILVHDGVEALLTIQRSLPAAVVLDAALPKMYGFQICEFLKRNESLRHIPVVLVGAIHDRHRYRRDPSELYGADAYLERPQLPEALWPMLRGFGISLGNAAPGSDPEQPAPPARPRVAEPTPAPIAAEPESLPEPEPLRAEPRVESPAPPAPTSAAAPSAQVAPPQREPASTLDPEVAKAERLARIVVSDIILYNQEKFDAAVRAGNVVAAMSADLEEGRALFTQRIDARVRESRDFLTDELIRVAEMRRSQ